MTIVRSGATQKYANGWERAFGRSDKKAQAGASTVKSKVKSVAKVGRVNKKRKKISRTAR
jgi:hypothetical protein